MAKKQRKRVRIGDILEIRILAEFAYLHYVGEHDTYGQTIHVLPKCYSQRPDDLESLVKKRGYLTFYPVNAAIAEGLAEIVGTVDLPPDIKMPCALRTPWGFDKNGKIIRWRISYDGEKKDVLKKTLNASEKQLTIEGCVGHPYLVHMIASGWTPDYPYKGLPPVGEEVNEFVESLYPPEEDENETGSIKHYLYFPNKTEATRVSKLLREQGFSTKQSRNDDDKNWLVLASYPGEITTEEFEEIRETLEEAAEEHGGEYDGWEAKVE